VAAGVSVTGHRAVDNERQRRTSVRDRTGSYRGETLWTFAGNGSFRSSPTVVDGTVYAGTTNRLLYAIDAETAEELWRFEVGPEPERTDKAEGIWSSPQVKDGRLFVGANDYTLYALDAETGAELWRYETDKHVQSSPTVVDGTVYVSGRDLGMYALDAETGAEVWTEEIGISGASPAVVDGSVYSGSYTTGGPESGKVASFDAATGEEEWRVDGIDTCSSPIVVDGTVVIGALDEYVYGLDAETGEQVWRTELPGAQDFAMPTAKDGTVYITGWGGETGLRALDAGTGEEEWHAETYSAGHQSPTVVDDTVFIVNQNAELFSVARSDGSVNWRERLHEAPIENATQGSAVVVDGILFTGGEDGRVRAVETGVDGSSNGKRVTDGVLNHHHSWAGTGPQTLDVEAQETTATATPTETTTRPTDGYGDWFANVGNYDGTVDLRGRSEVTIAVGAGEDGMLFSPAAALVDPGTTVVWEWTGRGGGHNVVSTDGTVSSRITSESGHTVSATLSDPGVLRYFCRPHRPSGMKGAVAVGSVDDELLAPATATPAGTTTGDDNDGMDTADDGPATDGEPGSGGTPGPGVVGTIAALGGASYLLRRRLLEDD
jgi:halocyanin-like protein